MDLLSKLSLGFHAALGARQLLALLCGCLLGLLAGQRRRLSPMSVLALLLPLVPAMDALSALAMLAAVAYGSAWGQTLAHRPALGFRGRAQFAPLLAGAAGAVGTLALALFAQPLAALAFDLGAADDFALMVFVLVGATVLGPGSVLVSLAMAVLGLLVAQLAQRAGAGGLFAAGLPQIGQGVPLVPLMIGLFAGAELIDKRIPVDAANPPPMPAAGETPPVTELPRRSAAVASARGLLAGLVLGLLPGAGARLAAALGRGVETRLRGDDERARCGELASVAAGHAGSHTAFIPMLMLGAPINAVMALLFAAMAIKGEPSGPLLLTGQPQIFWGLCASMWVGCLVLTVLGHLRLIPGRERQGPGHRWISAPLLVACCAGAAAGGPDAYPGFSVAVMGGAALAGYVFRKLSCQAAPFALAFILGPHMEGHLRHALQLSSGDWRVFLERPVALSLLLITVALVLLSLLPFVRRVRERVFGQPWLADD
ncbi:tripartite tricarboxylate transporter permease [Pelomonas sp. KK5]|uniref:tripartite tricarboxylate transporter permease n=1 Tax=Pelomonas sp. KK5 TaxID=1855730 RepID=UPI00097C0F93|nr:tripartite tricarboxylate transporter permease [Pelomonas sp. KK5]